MPTQCASVIKAEVIRLTRLDTCGLPVTGASSAQIVMDAFTELANTPNYEEGQRYLLKKANGQPCVNTRDPGFLNWIEQVIQLCTLDPSAFSVVTGDRLIQDGTTGTGVAFGEGLLTAVFSIEVWQPVTGINACTEGGDMQYVYWAFPFAYDAQLQAFTFQNDTFTLGWRSFTKAANPAWDLGADWLPAGFEIEDGEHFLWNITDVAPPVATCGAVTI